MTKDRALFEKADTWLQENRKVALATVIETWGSSPRPVGSHLVVSEEGDFLGSVSGGCVESAVIDSAMKVIRTGEPRTLEFTVADERAWEVGLSCGGSIRLLVELLSPTAVDSRRTAESQRPHSTAFITRLNDGVWTQLTPAGFKGDLSLNPGQKSEAATLLESNRSGISTDQSLFIKTCTPPPRLILVGAVHIAQVLAPMADTAGFEVTLVDPRRGFATETRFPDTDLQLEWPDKALPKLLPDSMTAIVTLSHDPKIDDPALKAALDSNAFYIGALGSQRTHSKRIDRLTEAGLTSALHRIHAPVGLDLGGRSPAEIAVSIIAEMIRAFYHREQ